MDVVRFTDVDRHNQSGVRCMKSGVSLRFAQVAPCLVRGFVLYIAIVGQLHDTKWEVAFAPAFAPGSDHRWQQDAVLLRSRFVRFALIPYGAAHEEGDDWSNRAVINRGGDPILAQGVRYWR